MRGMVESRVGNILCGDLQRNLRNMRIQEANMRVLNICITQTYVSCMLSKWPCANFMNSQISGPKFLKFRGC
jgi:hypothetical protein